MKKSLKEQDIDLLVRKIKIKLNESETKEGIFDPIKDAYTGLKGVWRGEGYDYFKYLSSLQSQIKTLKRLDEPNKKIFLNLNNLKQKIQSSKMSQQKKDNIENAINLAIQHFDAYQNLLDSIENLIKQKIS